METWLSRNWTFIAHVATLLQGKLCNANVLSLVKQKTRYLITLYAVFVNQLYFH